MKTKSLLAVMCIMAAVISIGTSYSIEHVYANVLPNDKGNNNTKTTATISTAKTIQHWEKFDFLITSRELAAKLGVSPNTELNVKILSDPNSIEDMRQAILDSFKKNTTESDKSAIHILGTLNDVICAQ
jgi:galactitol-specific phosphotransferase system IIB component